jgi:hypothetical protein
METKDAEPEPPCPSCAGRGCDICNGLAESLNDERTVHLKKYTVDVLMVELRRRGSRVNGLKNDVVNRLLADTIHPMASTAGFRAADWVQQTTRMQLPLAVMCSEAALAGWIGQVLSSSTSR